MKPTPKQLSYLRSLASSRGQTFTMPTTRLEASQEINRLKRAPKESYRDVRRELHQLADDMATRRGNAASRVGDHEVTGWGSSARWA